MAKVKDICKFLIKHPGYLKWGKQKLADKFNASVKDVVEAKILAEQKDNVLNLPTKVSIEEWEAFQKFKKTRSKIRKNVKRKLPKPFLKGSVFNVLVIGDIHEPFSLKGYLEFCREQQEKYNCGTVVFIGDVLDNHYSSYHETETNGMGADEELEQAIQKLQEWYKVFPEAYVTIGNHDRMAYRKAKTSGLSSKWVRGYSEILGTDGWEFVEEVEIYGVNYNHGEGGTARTKMKNELQSQVQGHLHQQGYIEFSEGKHQKIFGMQVGCGVNNDAYAMAYGKNFKKPVISCGVVLNKGKLPIVIPMEL
jgi:predicted phosphodiesterase